MLLGRDQEQQALVRLLENARAGRSGVLAIVGGAGIGKSALLAYTEEQAVGMTVSTARPAETRSRFWSWAGSCTALWRAPCPTPKPTAGPGISRWPPP
jgi:AAA ATPase-like protein